MTALDRAAERKVPLVFLDRRERRRETSWSVVRDKARAVAAGLERHGLRPGDRVGIAHPTGRGFLDAFFGTLVAGAVPVPLYPPVRLGRMDVYRRKTAALLASVDARALLADSRSSQVLAGLETSVPLHRTAHLAEGAQAEPTVRAVAADDLALVQFSSGTTADPKPVALTHRALLAQVSALNCFWPETAEVEHSGLSWLPLYHDMGLVGCVLVAVVRPGPLTLLPPELFVARPASWLRALSTTHATISPAPTFAFAHCVDRIRDEEMDGVDLSAWRFAICGAETVVPEVLDRFVERFAAWGFRREALIPGYGLAEAALAVTSTRPGRGPKVETFSRRALAEEGRARPDPAGTRIVALGKPLAGYRVEVRSQEGRSLPEGRVGRVWITGPSLMKGYLGDPEATRRALVDGWLDTGDLGFLLDGELYHTGRAKDILIVRGRNHAPEELERVVNQIPGVVAGGAAATTHRGPNDSSERLFVFVERARGSSGAAADLEEVCRRQLLAVTGLSVDEVAILPPGTLPRTSSGKIRRREALERHLSTRPAARTVATSAETR